MDANPRVLPDDVAPLGEAVAVGLVGGSAAGVLVDVVDVDVPPVALDASTLLVTGDDHVAQ